MENFEAASTPGGIERQEAEGQAKLVANFDTLPKEVFPQSPDIAGILGFKILGEADEIFMRIEAPEGWQLKPTSHSMHSDLIDANGRKRAGLFYKAAFYDRRASLTWLPRYRETWKYEGETSVGYGIEDCETGEFVELRQFPENSTYEVEKPLREEIHEILQSRFPDHSNPLAYWTA